MSRAFVAMVALAVAGCSVPKQGGFDDVRKAVADRTQHTIFWNQGGEADAEVARAVRAMLSHEIAVNEAVQIALLENPTLQATYEDLAVAQADLVQAGLLANPTFSGLLHLPLDTGAVSHWELGAEEDFLSIFMIPAKRRIARAEFEAAKLRVGHEVVTLAYDVRAAYFTLQGAQQLQTLRRTIFEGAQAAFAVADEQHRAGNLSDLDFATEQGVMNRARFELTSSDAQISGVRERLVRLMGLWGPDATFRIRGALPDLPARDPPLDHLESFAMKKRLDVAAARATLDARVAELAAAKDFRFIGKLEAGAALDRDAEGPHSVGPQGSIELPLFDQHQAGVAKMEAEARRAAQRFKAVAIDARSEVREARARVEYARSSAEYQRDVVIPNRERIVQLSDVHYGAMLVSVYRLLDAKESEVGAYRDYIEAVRDYWIARADLGRAIGGRLPQ